MLGGAPKVDRSPLPAAPTLEDPAVEKARADAVADLRRKQSTAATAILAQQPSGGAGANDNTSPAVRRLLGAA